VNLGRSTNLLNGDRAIEELLTRIYECFETEGDQSFAACFALNL
jgi:hypothetical protein